MAIAVIPARGGSKRIPRKNIKSFSGMPMICHSISIAKEANLFSHIVVSTDDEEIAEIAKSAGGEILFKRPQDLADDLTPTVPVVAHSIKLCREFGYEFEHVCCIYPCAPFISTVDLIKTYKIIKSKNIDFIYPVAEYAHPIQRAMRMDQDGSMKFLNPEAELTRTQDLENVFHDAGQFYWGKASSWLELKKMHTDGFGFPIDNWRAVDIDTEQDWQRAELLLQVMRSEGLDD